jgi:hypothetical protein
VVEGFAMLGTLFFSLAVLIISVPVVLHYRRKQANPPPSMQQRTDQIQAELDATNKYIESLEG